MKKYNRNYFGISTMLLGVVAFALCLTYTASAQRNLNIPDSISRNFHKEVQMRQKYWDTIGVNMRKGDYKQFNRWKAFWEQRVNADGSYPSPEHIYKAFQTGASDYKRLKSDKFQSMPQWEDIGNKKNPTGDINHGGVGRINTIRQSPNNPDEIWAGSASGGVWRSKNKGQNWEPLYQTEFLSLGVSDIAFAKSNPSVVYVATGDFDGSTANNVSYSVGIIKSIDGGETWNTTQTVWTLPENKLVSRLWVHPDNENIILAATGNGIIKSIDGGETWNTTLQSHRVADLEQMPDNPNVLYASTMDVLATANSDTRVYKTTDMGNTWTLVTSFGNGGKRTCLAVTPAAPNSIYALTANNLNGFHSVSISSDAGDTWENTNVYTTKRINYLVSSDFSNKTDGQGHYDLAIAVHPNNPNMIFIGGVNIWRSTDKGRNFTQVANWQGNGAAYVHADIHDLNYMDTVLYVGHDGGVDYTASSSNIQWEQRYEGMGINQIYAIHSAPTDTRQIIIGLQDLGTIRRDTNNEWHYVSGGDGMQCYFDPIYDTLIYSSVYNGKIYKHEVQPDGTVSEYPTSIIDSGIVYNNFKILDRGAWVTAFAISQQNPNKIYVGYSNIYYHPDRGTNWTKWEKQTNNNYSDATTFRNIKIYEKDDNIIYANTLNSIVHTTDGGAKWLPISLPSGAQNITNIAIHPDDPKILYATFSGYTDHSKLYKWDGNSWINLSGNLPNVPANCIALQVENGTTKLYVGTDIGVYYGVNEACHYVRWGIDMPNLIVTQLEIIPATKQLRAATYGRGLWETTLNECVHETIEIKADGDVEFCENDSLRLYVDTPNESDIVWSTGETGNEIWVKRDGIYHATSNASTECFKYSNSITATTKYAMELNIDSSGSLNICTGDSVELSVSMGFNSYIWTTGETENRITVKEPGTYSVTAVNASGCLSQSQTVVVNTYARPEPTTVNYTKFDTTNADNKDKKPADTLEAVAEDALRYQWYLNGRAISSASGGTTRRIVVPIIKSNEGDWTVTVAYEGTCFSEQSEPIFVNDIKENNDNIYFNITPKPATNDIMLSLDEKHWGQYSVQILDMQGATVKTIDNLQVNKSTSAIDISSLPAGSYVVRITSSTKTFSDIIIKTDK